MEIREIKWGLNSQRNLKSMSDLASACRNIGEWDKDHTEIYMSNLRRLRQVREYWGKTIWMGYLVFDPVNTKDVTSPFL
jgi:hypothetical protein